MDPVLTAEIARLAASLIVRLVQAGRGDEAKEIEAIVSRADANWRRLIAVAGDPSA